MPEDYTDAVYTNKNDSFVLPGRGIVHVRYQWSSVGDHCQTVDWVDINAEWDGGTNYLFEPTRWKPHVCSTMQISGYRPGPAPEAEKISGKNYVLEITSPSSPIYADEWVKLSLELKSGDGTIQPTGRCPEIYAVYQNGTGTRFESILPDGYGTLVNIGSTQPNGIYISGYGDQLPAEFKGSERLCDATGKSKTTQVSLPASLKAPIHMVPTPNLSTLRHIVWRAETADTRESVFVAADTQFNILDPDKLPPNWGPIVDGIGVGLSVDRTSFKLGDVIPLHLHWENFGAKVPVGETEFGDPAPQLEIQDASHHVLNTLDTSDRSLMGHGWGPFSIPIGKPQQTFVALDYGNQGYGLASGQAGINGPGIYYLVLTWSPKTLEVKLDEDELSMNDQRFLGKTYTTARSLPVRILIYAK